MNKFLVFALVLCVCALLICAQEAPTDEMVPPTLPQDQPQLEQETQQQPEAQRRFWKKHYHYGADAGYPAYGYQYGYPSYGYGYGYRPYGYGYRPYGYGR